jgi:hypothetical protein
LDDDGAVADARGAVVDAVATRAVGAFERARVVVGYAGARVIATAAPNAAMASPRSLRACCCGARRRHRP